MNTHGSESVKKTKQTYYSRNKKEKWNWIGHTLRKPDGSVDKTSLTCGVLKKSKGVEDGQKYVEKNGGDVRKKVEWV